MSAYDLVIRNAYLHDRDRVADIAVDNGRIEAVTEIARDGTEEIDAGGDLVSPGLIDSHVHYDWAFSAGGGRRPAGNDVMYDQTVNVERLSGYMASASPADIRRSVREAAAAATANGVLHARTHAYVDGDVGTKGVKAVLDVRERLAPTFDLQVVSFPQKGYLADPGSIRATRRALELGADLVGGIDPGSVNERVEETIATWFDLAEEFDTGIDAHIHDPGSLGRFTLGRLAEATIERGFENRVTASHAYALGDDSRDTARFPQGSLESVLEAMSEAELSVVTCYMTTPDSMPVERIREFDIPLGHGTDQVQDLWFAHGNADVIQGALVESLRLAGTRDYASNGGLRELWELITTESARALGIEGYGIESGTPANLVVHGAPSPEWVLVRQPPRRSVISSGEIVARDGELTTSFG